MEVQFAAVRAAGELELSEAREPLLLLLDSHSQFDEELYNAIIWSLSQIGGEDVRAALELLLELAEENEEDELLEFLEQALENLDFNEGAQFFEMLDLDLPEDPEKDELEPFDNFPEDEE
jgi:HEAT repeat protein